MASDTTYVATLCIGIVVWVSQGLVKGSSTAAPLQSTAGEGRPPGTRNQARQAPPVTFYLPSYPTSAMFLPCLTGSIVNYSVTHRHRGKECWINLVRLSKRVLD